MTGRHEDPLSELEWRLPEPPCQRVANAIRSECTAGLCKKKGASRMRRMSASIALFAGTIVVLAFLGITREGAIGDGVRAALYGAAGWGAVLSAILFSSLARPPGRRLGAGYRLFLAIAVPLVFLGYLALTATGRIPFSAFSVGEYADHALRCGLLCMFFGAAISGGIFFLWRGTDPATPGLSGALVGLAGGMGSALAFGIACPSHEAYHQWFSHGLVVVTMVLLGVLVGRRLFAP
jgi:hypothetical protein